MVNDFDQHHDLHLHLKTLRECSPARATQLDEAFSATVLFYGLNPNRRELRHLESLDDYLSVVGTANAFQKMRYWELDQPTDDPLIGKVWLPIHSEILRATEQLFLREGRRVQTIIDRVERAVHGALLPSDRLGYSPGTEQEQSVIAYIKWVKTFPSRREAFASAVQQKFSVGDDYANHMVLTAYRTLAELNDAAVSFFVSRSAVLPSQPREPTPPVDWLDSPQEHHGTVRTPGGTLLGFVDRSVDGVWNITPAVDGPVRVAALARSQTDARCYLAQLLSVPTNAIIDGSASELRLVGEEFNLFEINYQRIDDAGVGAEETDAWTHKLTVWDSQHGISEGQTVRFEVIGNETRVLMNVLEGSVVKVEGPEIFVLGIDSLEPRRELDI